MSCLTLPVCFNFDQADKKTTVYCISDSVWKLPAANMVIGFKLLTYIYDAKNHHNVYPNLISHMSPIMKRISWSLTYNWQIRNINLGCYSEGYQHV